MDKEEIYLQKMHCGNCGHSYVKEFPKGSTAHGLYTCENCGCREAKSTGMPREERDRINFKSL